MATETDIPATIPNDDQVEVPKNVTHDRDDSTTNDEPSAKRSKANITPNESETISGSTLLIVEDHDFVTNLHIVNKALTSDEHVALHNFADTVPSEHEEDVVYRIIETKCEKTHAKALINVKFANVYVINLNVW